MTEAGKLAQHWNETLRSYSCESVKLTASTTQPCNLRLEIAWQSQSCFLLWSLLFKAGRAITPMRHWRCLLPQQRTCDGHGMCSQSFLMTELKQSSVLGCRAATVQSPIFLNLPISGATMGFHFGDPQNDMQTHGRTNCEFFSAVPPSGQSEVYHDTAYWSPAEDMTYTLVVSSCRMNRQ